MRRQVAEGDSRVPRRTGHAAAARRIPRPRVLRRALVDDRGLETAEYAIIAGMILTGLLAVVLVLGRWVRREVTQLKTGVGA